MNIQRTTVVTITNSDMVAIPMQENDIESIEVLAKRLENAKTVKSENFSLREQAFTCDLICDGEKCRFSAEIGECKAPPILKKMHTMPVKEMNRILHAKKAVFVSMKFGKNYAESYHAQLKAICEMIPDLAGVSDISAGTLLAGGWVKLNSESEVPPSPLYYYGVQAVCGNDGRVWAHTHGLNRCGFIELELLNCSKETYNECVNAILSPFAQRMLETPEGIGEGVPVFVAQLNGGFFVNAAWMNWHEALSYYPSDICGGVDDRDDIHGNDRGTLFYYKSEEDAENFTPTMIDSISPEALVNAIGMISNEETHRMSMLAQNRVEYLRAGYKKLFSKAIVKMCTPVDEDKCEQAGTNNEHIWYDLLKFDGDVLHCRATQDAYYIDGLVEGTIRDFKISDITDWRLKCGGNLITPDTAFLLDKRFK